MPLKYAAPWKRGAAFLLDAALVAPLALFAPLAGAGALALSGALFEASGWQATPGKRWLGLRVIEAEGPGPRRWPPPHALGPRGRHERLHTPYRSNPRDSASGGCLSVMRALPENRTELPGIFHLESRVILSRTSFKRWAFAAPHRKIHRLSTTGFRPPQ
jgi:hypothetical protein